MWVGDLYITYKTMSKKGYDIEVNPIIRSIFRIRKKFIWPFKIIELGAFLYLIYYLANIGNIVPFYVLLVYIFVYAVFVANNSRVYFMATGKESDAFKVIFILLVLGIVLFIYLNYMLYTNLGTSFAALTECNSDYVNLYSQCKTSGTASNYTSTPDNLMKIVESLNLSLPKGFGK
jgi:hypothetical protein